MLAAPSDTDGLSTSKTLSFFKTGTLDGIPVMWQSTDTAVVELWSQQPTMTFPSNTATSTADSAASESYANTASPQSTSSSTPTATNSTISQPSGHLSQGSVIAISVLSTCTAVAMMLAVVFFCIRRRKKHDREATRSNDGGSRHLASAMSMVELTSGRQSSRMEGSEGVEAAFKPYDNIQNMEHKRGPLYEIEDTGIARDRLPWVDGDEKEPQQSSDTPVSAAHGRGRSHGSQTSVLRELSGISRNSDRLSVNIITMCMPEELNTASQYNKS